jgi:SAM-dependent methyltransferase
MFSDRLKWNEKYRRKDYPAEPSSLVQEFCGLARGTAALDLAAGNGRNALFLANQGFTVDAVDISDVGLTLMAGRHQSVRAICVDLDTFEIPAERYDLIVNILFLNRRLFPQIQEGLRRGGLLIFESLLEAPRGNDRGEHCRDFYLRENELLRSFLSLRILHYHEELHSSDSDHDRRLASLVAVRNR